MVIRTTPLNSVATLRGRPTGPALERRPLPLVVRLSYHERSHNARDFPFLGSRLYRAGAQPGAQFSAPAGPGSGVSPSFPFAGWGRVQRMIDEPKGGPNGKNLLRE